MGLQHHISKNMFKSPLFARRTRHKVFLSLNRRCQVFGHTFVSRSFSMVVPYISHFNCFGVSPIASPPTAMLQPLASVLLISLWSLIDVVFCPSLFAHMCFVCLAACSGYIYIYLFVSSSRALSFMKMRRNWVGRDEHHTTCSGGPQGNHEGRGNGRRETAADESSKGKAVRVATYPTDYSGNYNLCASFACPFISFVVFSCLRCILWLCLCCSSFCIVCHISWGRRYFICLRLLRSGFSFLLFYIFFSLSTHLNCEHGQVVPVVYDIALSALITALPRRVWCSWVCGNLITYCVSIAIE